MVMPPAVGQRDLAHHKEWPEECDKELKALTLPPNCPNCNQIEHLWEVPEGVQFMEPNLASDLAISFGSVFLGVSQGVWHQGIGSNPLSCKVPH